MRNEGFPRFLDQIKQVVRKIDRVITDDTFLSGDRPILTNRSPYWRSELGTNMSARTGLQTASSMFVRGDAVKHLIGNAWWMTKAQRTMIETAIVTYMHNDERLFPVSANMDYVWLRQTKLMSKESVTKAAISGAGPFILKILQQLASTNKNIANTPIGRMLSSVFSAVPGMLPEEYEMVVKHLQLPSGVHIDPRILGSASIAEAHISTYRGKDTVVKFLKPVYAFYFLCEVDFLLHVTYARIKEAMQKTFADSREEAYRFTVQSRRLLLYFIREFAKEFDYKLEYANTLIGREVYAGDEIRVAAGIALSTNFPAILSQRAAGEPLNVYMTRPSADWRGVYYAVDKLVRRWFRNVLWGNGFFHADPHTGNMLYDGRHLTMIDFGSSGIIDKRLRKRLVESMLTLFGPTRRSLRSDDARALFDDGPEGKYYNGVDNRMHERKGDMLQRSIRHNREVLTRFVDIIWGACEARNTNTAGVVDALFLTYEQNGAFYFSTLLIKMFTVSESMGLCVVNELILFGRGMAYLQDTLEIASERAGLKMADTGEIVGGIMISSTLGVRQLIRYFARRRLA